MPTTWKTVAYETKFIQVRLVMITLGKMWISYEVNTIFIHWSEDWKEGYKRTCVYMKSSILNNGLESILNEIVGCNAFLFMKTLENAYPYWVDKLVTNAMG